MICLQSYCGGRPHDADAMVRHLECCVADVADWYAAKRLQLNADITELLWRLSPNTKAITVGRNVSNPPVVSGMRNLGVQFDLELSMRRELMHVVYVDNSAVKSHPD